MKELPLWPPPRSFFRERCPTPQSPLHPSLKVPGRWALLQVPQTGPLWEEMPPSPEPFLHFLQCPQQGIPLFRFPSQSYHTETLHLQSPFQPYLKVSGRWARSRLSNWAPIKRDAHPQSLPFITFRAPRKGAPPPGSPIRAPIETDAPFPEPPYNYLSEFPVNGPP